MQASYILPIRREFADESFEFTRYLRWLSRRLQVIVVDGSAPAVFAAHAARWGRHVRHLPVAPDLLTPNGKVGGVLTGVRYALHERLVLADDDVRYDDRSLQKVVAGLAGAHVVRPQNYFDPLPWHARWDTGRMLLNRMLGGDWPGTLAVRRSALLATGGYRGDALFENLELVRTIVAAGGIERLANDLFVRRLAPTARHFWSQRTRQAYDEWARPHRLAAQAMVLPLGAALLYRRRWSALGACIAAIAVLAEEGRQRDHGTTVFGASAALWAPLWVLERGVCAWLAIAMRLFNGGVRYRSLTLRQAATPLPRLRLRFEAAGVWLQPVSA